jgi:hypothetical protein
MSLNSAGRETDDARVARVRRRRASEANRHVHNRRVRNRWLLWGGLSALLLVVATGTWVGVRVVMAKDALMLLQAEVQNTQDYVAAGNVPQALSVASEIEQNAHRAAELTSDVVWRSWEWVPVLGTNLAAVRESAQVVDYVASQAVQPLVEVAGSVTVDGLKPVDGAIALAPIAAAQAKIALVSYTLMSATNEAAAIDTAGTLGVVSDAVEHLHASLAKASGVTTSLNRAVQLLPAMLGSQGARHYLLLAENLAEVRATGGIPGAVAVLDVAAGKVTLGTQTSAVALKKFVPPVAGLNDNLQHLYSNRPAEYMQNTTMVPDFAQAAQLASNMWLERTGQTVDGVISVDPVALSYLLKATGPVTLATGEQLTAENAVPLLLKDVYARYNPEVQDLFFGAAAKAVFEKVAGGGAKASSLIEALSKAGSENRLLLWSAHPEEQVRLAETTLAGGLPQSTGMAGALGLYLNDGTGSKMDYYLRVELASGTRVCRADGRTGYVVQAKLTNIAPADAGTSLPAYVTGGGAFGVTPGVIATQVNAYGAPGMQRNTAWATDALVGDARASTPPTLEPIATGVDDQRPVMQAWVELAPGQSKTVVFEFLGAAGDPRSVTLAHSPALNLTETQNSPVGCF